MNGDLRSRAAAKPRHGATEKRRAVSPGLHVPEESLKFSGGLFRSRDLESAAPPRAPCCEVRRDNRCMSREPLPPTVDVPPSSRALFGMRWWLGARLRGRRRAHGRGRRGRAQQPLGARLPHATPRSSRSATPSRRPRRSSERRVVEELRRETHGDRRTAATCALFVFDNEAPADHAAALAGRRLVGRARRPRGAAHVADRPPLHHRREGRLLVRRRPRDPRRPAAARSSPTRCGPSCASSSASSATSSCSRRCSLSPSARRSGC